MKANRIIMCAATVCIVGLALAGCGNKEEALPNVPLDSNLVVNPSFEEWQGKVPTGWRIEHFAGDGKRENEYGKSIDFSKSGRFSFYLRGIYDSDRWMVLVQTHPVIPGYRLSFSAEMKADGLERWKKQEDRANIYVRFYDRDGKRVSDRYYADMWTSRLVGTNDWRQYSKVTDIPKNARTVEIGCINEMTGFLYFDDVDLRIEAPVPWHEKKMKHVNFYYLEGHPLSPEAMKETDQYLDSCLKKLHTKVKGKVSYYYYPSEEKFREMFGVRRAHERLFPKRQELHTPDSADRHEVVHLLLEPLGYPPFGLAEGTYLFCAGSWEGRDLHMLTKQYLIQRRLPALYMVLGGEDMDKVGLSVTAPAWGSFCMWLISHKGPKKFMQLYVKTDGVEEAGTFNSIFKGIYGEDFDVMDREWRLWVLRYNPK
jgi:hypothetical protein